MRTIVKIDYWGETFIDVLPYLTSTDINMLVCCIVDDINGLLDEVYSVGVECRDFNAEKFSSLVKYCVTQLGNDINDNSLSELCDGCVNLIELVFKELSNHPEWANYRHKVERHRISHDSSSLTLYLESHLLYDSSERACELMYDVAQRILECYKVALCRSQSRSE